LWGEGAQEYIFETTYKIPKRVLYMNFETTRLTGRPRNRWQDKVREDG